MLPRLRGVMACYYGLLVATVACVPEHLYIFVPLTHGRTHARFRGPSATCGRAVLLGGISEKIELFTICSGNAPISTGACPGIVKSRTVLILCRYEVYSHLRPSYSHHFFRKLTKSGVCTSRHGNDFRESIACFHAAVLVRASCPTTPLDP